MHSCCRSAPCNEMFSAKEARRNLRRYRGKGLGALERQMVETVGSTGLGGARILEIGGGIGTIQAELVASGAARGEVVELVGAYEPYARELAREKGLEDRLSFRVADVLADPGSVEPADVVVLNRVVCCTPEGVELTAVAARLAARTLVLSFPRDRVFVRLALRLMNGWTRLRGRSFRVFLHPRSQLVATAESEGLRLFEGAPGGYAWEFVALGRAA